MIGTKNRNFPYKYFIIIIIIIIIKLIWWASISLALFYFSM